MTGYQGPCEFGPAERELFLTRSHQFLNATKFAAKMLSRDKFASALPLMISYYLTIGLEHSYD